MGLVVGQNGLARAQRAVAQRLHCAHCETVTYGITVRDASLDDLSLAWLAQPLEPVDLICPRCPDTRLTSTETYSAFLPDEAELPALCWQRDAADSEPEWFLLDVPAAATGEAAEHFAAALIAGANRRALASVDEETLEREWGRVLSVRARWRLLLADTETYADARGCDPSPGMLLVASPVPPPAPGKVKALLSRMEGRRTEMVRLVCEPGDPNGAGTWAGPWAGKLDSDLIAYTLIDLDEIDRRIAEIALQYGLDPLLEPPPEQKWSLADPETGVEPLWFRLGEMTLPVVAAEVRTTAALAGTTIAEAVHLLVAQEAQRAGLVLRLADHLRGAGCEVIVRHTREIELVAGDRSLVLQPSGILTRFGLDPDAPALLREVESIAESVSRAGEAGSLQALLCPCGETRLTRHLRPAALDSDAPPAVEHLHDDRGQEFLLVPTLECPHRVHRLAADAAKVFAEEGWNVEQQLAAAPPPDLYAEAAVVRDAAGEPCALRLEGTNIATSLAVPELTGELHELIAARFPADKPVVAIAATTDLVLVASADEEMSFRLDTALTDRLQAGPLPGIKLEFCRQLLVHGTESRAITLHWCESAASG